MSEYVGICHKKPPFLPPGAFSWPLAGAARRELHFGGIQKSKSAFCSLASCPFSIFVEPKKNKASCKGLADAQDLLLSQCDARGAALGLTALMGASQLAIGALLPWNGAEALRAAERATRDLVVWRCCRRDVPGDRNAFIRAAES